MRVCCLPDPSSEALCVCALPQLCSLVGANKLQMLELLVRRYGIDAQRSFAYGDHKTDIPILCRVGRPVYLLRCGH